MTHISPTVYTLWSIISVTLLGFFVSHLWKFDRFKCLRWGRGRNSGAFKRVMTFTYLISVPLLAVYSIGMMVIKYREGFVALPDHGIIPTPYQLWTPQNRRFILPLAMVFSEAWALEIVTHLEELMFWLFLISVKPQYSSWFRSLQFKTWAAGSILAVVGMPLLTWFTRHDPLKCEAFTFLGGSIPGLVITLWSTHVLWVFPGFVNRVKSAGGEPEVVVRLTTFHNLNITRVIFRFFMLVPLLILAVDGVTSHRHINESPLWTDFLASMGGIGMIVSSTVTLLIFFPRSIAREAGYKPQLKYTSGKSHEISLQPVYGLSNTHREVGDHDSRLPQNVPLSPTTKTQQLVEDDACIAHTEVWEMVTPNRNGASLPPYPHANRIDLNVSPRVILQPPARPQRPDLHPLLMNYSSPINFTEEDCSPPHRLYRPENPV